MIFEQNVKDTKFIFVLEQAELRVTRWYNCMGKTYSHEWDMNEITVSGLGELVKRFKQMPDEMWENIEPNVCTNFVPPNVQNKGIRRVGA